MLPPMLAVAAVVVQPQDEKRGFERILDVNLMGTIKGLEWARQRCAFVVGPSTL